MPMNQTNEAYVNCKATQTTTEKVQNSQPPLCSLKQQNLCSQRRWTQQREDTTMACRTIQKSSTHLLRLTYPHSPCCESSHLHTDCSSRLKGFVSWAMLVEPISKTCMEIKADQFMYAKKSLPRGVSLSFSNTRSCGLEAECWLWVVSLATVSLILPQSPAPTSTRCVHFRLPTISNGRIRLPPNRERTGGFSTLAHFATWSYT